LRRSRRSWNTCYRWRGTRCRCRSRRIRGCSSRTRSGRRGWRWSRTLSVLNRGIILIKVHIVASSCDVDIARAINRKGVSKITATAWSVVSHEPLFLSGGVVLDRRVIRVNPPGVKTGPCHVHIPDAIKRNRDGETHVRWARVIRNPLLLPVGVILHCRVS
jgi:hypothetical protein